MLHTDDHACQKMRSPFCRRCTSLSSSHYAPMAAGCNHNSESWAWSWICRCITKHSTHNEMLTKQLAAKARHVLWVLSSLWKTAFCVLLHARQPCKPHGRPAYMSHAGFRPRVASTPSEQGASGVPHVNSWIVVVCICRSTAKYQTQVHVWKYLKLADGTIVCRWQAFCRQASWQSWLPHYILVQMIFLCPPFTFVSPRLVEVKVWTAGLHVLLSADTNCVASCRQCGLDVQSLFAV